MADDSDEDENEGPLVELGEGKPVEGAPLARIASRLTWGISKSQIDYQEGTTVVRTPDGPRELSAVLADVNRTYFARRQDFEEAIRGVIGTGPIPTAEEDMTNANNERPTGDGDASTADGTTTDNEGLEESNTSGRSEDGSSSEDS